MGLLRGTEVLLLIPNATGNAVHGSPYCSMCTHASSLGGTKSSRDEQPRKMLLDCRNIDNRGGLRFGFPSKSVFGWLAASGEPVERGEPQKNEEVG